MTENEAFIYESIVAQVRMGFLSMEEIQDNIIEEIEDNELTDEISEKWAFTHIENEWKKQLNASKKWQHPTHTQRLIKAFDDLCDHNIIALHNAGYTNSDGEYEVVEVERALREKNRTSDGYCFYHEQDLSRAIADENPCLYLSFNKVDNTDSDVTISIGKKVVEILKQHGFAVEWEESSTRKIMLPNFKWQMQYAEDGRDLWDYSEVLQRMMK